MGHERSQDGHAHAPSGSSVGVTSKGRREAHSCPLPRRRELEGTSAGALCAIFSCHTTADARTSAPPSTTTGVSANTTGCWRVAQGRLNVGVRGAESRR